MNNSCKSGGGGIFLIKSNSVYVQGFIENNIVYEGSGGGVNIYDGCKNVTFNYSRISQNMI